MDKFEQEIANIIARAIMQALGSALLESTDNLQAQLSLAEEKEDYEKCAIIRDKINQLKLKK
jgi:protein-arginine kinase activator protein McsA